MGNLLPFDACWARYDRADEHRTRLPSIWNDYISDHPFDFSLTHRGEGVHVLEAFEKWPIPADFVLELGEWLYQVRSCLDFIVWATAVYDSGESPPPDEDRLQYPVCATEKAWRENLRRLQPLHDDHLKMLYAVQPFQGDADANWLAMINRLARVDRHRRLNVGTAYIAETDPVFQVPDGRDVTLQKGSVRLIDGYAEVFKLTIRPWADEDPIEVNPRMAFDPEVVEWAESPFWRRWSLDERLRTVQVFLAAEIAAYEYSCTGGSRKADLLQPEFRNDRDEARRSRGHQPVQQASPPETQWTEPKAGTPSTRERFEGRDYPSGSRQPPTRTKW